MDGTINMRHIPIVAVTGTNGKTTTTRMIAHILQANGRTVGMTTSDGIYVGGVQIAAGDMAGPRSAREILDDPRVDAAVLETARGGILRAGLAFDSCDVGVVTNVTEDHIGLRGIGTIEDLAAVKARVSAAVSPDGASVLNADNSWTVAMAADAGGEVIFFSLFEENPVIQRHCQAQGRAMVLRSTEDGEQLTLVAGDEATGIIWANEIPATMGARIRVNIANALAACAAAIALGLQPMEIAGALRTFTCDFAQTPGRFNLLTVDGRQVLLDYAHNVDGLAAVAEFVRRTDVPHRLAVIGIAGDRRDEDIRAFGELAGRTFDRIVIREHADLRGRAPGEVAGLLSAAVSASGRQDDSIKVVLDEGDAILTALDWAEPEDLVVALVYQIDRAFDLISHQRAVSA